MKNAYLLLLIIFLMSVILRFYNLGDIPVGLHRDEAFLGYNAYSILKTGKDMSGALLPMHLESFIYSPAGYSYFSIPFIALFDLNAFSTRFASALFGSLTIIVMYLLIKDILYKKLKTQNSKLKTATQSSKVQSLEFGDWNLEIVALFSAGILAVLPWHINLSRTATENVLVVFFICIGLFLFFHWVKKERFIFLLFSFFFFSLTLFLYQAPRAFLPLFIPFLIILFLRKNQLIKYLIQLFILYGLFIIFPLILTLLSPNLSLRIKTLSIFNHEYVPIILTEQITADGAAKMPYLLTRIFHNKAVAYTNLFLENYFNHLSFNFLFSDKGLPDRYRIPQAGLLYISMLPFLLIGAFELLKKEKRLSVFFLGWILITPIGSALTFDDVPNMQRTLISVPAFSFFIAYGTVTFFYFVKVKSRLFFLPIIGVLIFMFTYNIFYYFVQYYVQAKTYRPWYRHDGYKELVLQVNKLLSSYKQAVITNHESAPTIFFLFYSKYSPQEFQNETRESIMRSFDRISFYKYVFSEEECPLRYLKQESTALLTGKKGVLYVNGGSCEAQGIKVLNTIKRKDNSDVFMLNVIN